MFHRVSEFFCVPQIELLDYPVKLFWSMVTNLDKLKAEKALDSLNLLLVSNGNEESITEFRNSMIERMGTPQRKIVERTKEEDIANILAEWG